MELKRKRSPEPLPSGTSTKRPTGSTIQYNDHLKLDPAKACDKGSSVYSQQKLDLSQQQIRILRLLPGEWNEPIRCSLYTAYMSTHPPYEALSYAWGDPSDRWPIFVDGSLFEATSNLAAALRRLRTPAQARHLWVDAICINQADNIEKSHQVNLMKDIYSNAGQGLLWLGEFQEHAPGRNSTWPVESISNRKQVLSAGTSPSISGTAFAQPPSTLDSIIISEADALKALSLVKRLASNDHIPHRRLVEETQALSTLMGLAWWHRIWTVQEAVLPPKATIICGGLFVNWDLFASAAVSIYNHIGRCCNGNSEGSSGDVLINFHQRVDAIVWYKEARNTKYGPRRVFITFQNRMASDPRDKVFGLLGLFPPQMQHLSKAADYSLNKQQVYKRTAFYLIKEFGNLSPLLRGNEEKRRRTLPSWVPDLETKIDDTMLDHVLQWPDTYDLYDTASGTHLELGDKTLNDLRLKGVWVDEVSVLIKWSNYHRPTEVVEEVRGLVTSVFSLQDDYPMGGTYEGAFWRTLRRDFNTEDLGDGTTSYRRLSPSEFKHITSSDPQISYGATAFYLTKKGLIGVGPVDCRVGDKVYVLFGGRLPFILRPARKRGKQNCYRYVGQGYVHGIMDGEVLQTGDFSPEYVTL
ncbi:heterokaryon incompatibility protein-domain-containing protein, partial [Pestalotiopsis sp. NC0098]